MRLPQRSGEATAIWLSHGPIDGITTVAVHGTVGSHLEWNPIVRRLLWMGNVPTVLIMCLLVAVAALMWPCAADSLDAPKWVGYGVASIGLAAAAVNLVVISG